MYKTLKGIESTYVFLDSLTAGSEPQHTNTVEALRRIREVIIEAESEWDWMKE
jgi:DNA/RNA endonuclease YhcR with UshA esterase domain